jgi:hypothetical protein
MTKYLLNLFIVAGAIFVFSSCNNDDEPTRENTPELITKVTLTFLPVTGSPVIVTATDPDGDGPQDLEIDGTIELVNNIPYTLSISLSNTLVAETDPAYDISAEVEEEGDEHIFFFSWTNDVFNSPTGNGNIDSRADDVNYSDSDDNGLPLGLVTNWTGSNGKSGDFRIVLKHQPGIKSETSTASDGETDLDLTFTVNVN